MSEPKTCAFCLKNDPPFDREDVFAKWIAREFPNIEWTTYDFKSGAIRSRSIHKEVIGLICFDVCRRCNNEWMSVLEDRVIPILKPLIHAERNSPLTRSDQRKLAKWLIKTVNTFDVATQKLPDCFFSAAQRQALIRGAIPQNVSMFIGQFDGTLGDITALRGGLTPDPSLVPQDHRYLADTEGYVFTLFIKHVALQVFAYRSTNPLPKKLTFIPSPVWMDRVLTFWPLSASLNWPPRYTLDDTWITPLNERWFTAAPLLY